MIHYIIRDMTAMLRFLPYGIAVGIVVILCLERINNWRLKRNKKPFRVAAGAGFFTYVVIILCITFLSRESGSRNSIDLELFSTWGINTRNNAYVIENILLFVPFGFVCPWAVKCTRKFFAHLLTALVFSIGIETLQLAAGRGYFQVDDILTNVVGAVLGGILFWLVSSLGKLFKM